mmetsp:Transcript_8162/g.7754  ORF Transcript_8162/g.7754 Transcript_8162/m.7754 type:complete len:102 (-) Transcript_8162:33-338(-)
MMIKSGFSQKNSFLKDLILSLNFINKSKELGLTGGVYSRRSFGHGNRACPGQSFALLEMKIAIAYFTLHLEYNFSEEDLSKDGIGFALMSQFNPKVACKRK